MRSLSQAGRYSRTQRDTHRVSHGHEPPNNMLAVQMTFIYVTFLKTTEPLGQRGHNTEMTNKLDKIKGVHPCIYDWLI